jgi:hypothetical protein
MILKCSLRLLSNGCPETEHIILLKTVLKHTIILKNIFYDLNCCFTVHFDKYKIIFPTNALFIKT